MKIKLMFGVMAVAMLGMVSVGYGHPGVGGLVEDFEGALASIGSARNTWLTRGDVGHGQNYTGPLGEWVRNSPGCSGNEDLLNCLGDGAGSQSLGQYVYDGRLPVRFGPGQLPFVFPDNYIGPNQTGNNISSLILDNPFDSGKVFLSFQYAQSEMGG